MSWKTVSFESLYATPSRNGISVAKSQHDGETKIVNMGELFANDFIADIPMRRIKVEHRQLAVNALSVGDLLFARRSLVAAGAGKVSMVSALKEPTVFESSIIRVRLDQTKALPRYYAYWFRSPAGKDAISRLVTGTNVKGIRGSELKSIQVPAPSLEVQRRIASILMAYDNLIENNRRQIALLEEAAQRFYKEWFVDLRYPGYENAVYVDDLPTGWQRMPVADYADVVKECSYKTENIDVEQGVPMVNLASIASGGGYKPYTERTYGGTYKSEQVLDANDVVMALTEQTAGLAGYVARIPRYAQGSVPSMDLACLRPKKGSRTYLYCTCRYGDVSRLLSPLANGTKIKHLKQEALSYTDMVVAPTELQQRFEDAVHPMFTNVDVLMEQNEKLRVARDRLLPKLMSGEIEVEG